MLYVRGAMLAAASLAGQNVLTRVVTLIVVVLSVLGFADSVASGLNHDDYRCIRSGDCIEIDAGVTANAAALLPLASITSRLCFYVVLSSD